MLDFLSHFFSLASLGASRVILSVVFGIISAILTFWGFSSGSGWFLLFGLVSFVLVGASAGLTAESAGAAGLVALVYFTYPIVFGGAVRQMCENQEMIESLAGKATPQQLQKCSISGADETSAP